jgi:hypothetical protein
MPLVRLSMWPSCHIRLPRTHKKALLGVWFELGRPPQTFASSREAGFEDVGHFCRASRDWTIFLNHSAISDDLAVIEARALNSKSRLLISCSRGSLVYLIAHECCSLSLCCGLGPKHPAQFARKGTSVVVKRSSVQPHYTESVPTNSATTGAGMALRRKAKDSLRRRHEFDHHSAQ